MHGLRQPLSDSLGLSGLLLSATDPETTMLGTATVVDQLPEAMAAPWMHNEFGDDDFNKFSQLHRTGSGATTLHRVTQGRPSLSPRHSRLHHPHGLGPELRVTFSHGKACWGIANLVRAAADPDFGDAELHWLDGLRPMVTAGIQRTTAQLSSPEAQGEVSGVVSLDPTGSLLSMTSAAERMLADLWLCPLVTGRYRLPGEAYMIATAARARSGSASSTAPPVTRLRGRSGRWLTIQGDSTRRADGTVTGIVLVIQPSGPAEVLPIVVAAYGLSTREQEVLHTTLGGATAGEVGAQLFISEHTVRDHITSILAKTGTASRGELTDLLFQHRALWSPEPG